MNGEDRPRPDSGIDKGIAGLLITLTAIGIPGNIASIIFFIMVRGRNGNNRFFNRLYLTISGVDCLSILCAVPIIYTLISDSDRQDTKFTGNTSMIHPVSNSTVFYPYSNLFCSFWIYFSDLVHALSVFLVSVLSISRLLILMKPTMRLRPVAVIVAPVVLILVFLAIYIGLDKGEIMVPEYGDHTASCYMRAFIDFSKYPTKPPFAPVFLRFRLAIGFGVWGGFMVLPIVPITISFFLSLYYLKAKNKVRSTKASLKRQNNASFTIVIVTCIYVICNMPIAGFSVYLVTRLVGGLRTTDLPWPVFDDLLQFNSFYFWLCLLQVSVVVNAAANPLVYCWRMRSFRQFIADGGVIRAGSTRRRNMSLVTEMTESNLFRTFNMSIRRQGSKKTIIIDKGTDTLDRASPGSAAKLATVVEKAAKLATVGEKAEEGMLLDPNTSGMSSLKNESIVISNCSDSEKAGHLGSDEGNRATNGGTAEGGAIRGSQTNDTSLTTASLVITVGVSSLAELKTGSPTLSPKVHGPGDTVHR